MALLELEPSPISIMDVEQVHNGYIIRVSGGRRNQQPVTIVAKDFQDLVYCLETVAKAGVRSILAEFAPKDAPASIGAVA